MNAKELVERYLWAQRACWMEQTWVRAASGLRGLLRTLGADEARSDGPPDEAELTQAGVLRFARAVMAGRARNGAPWSATYQRQLITTARAFLRWCAQQGLLLQDLGVLLHPPPRGARLPRTLSEDQVTQLLGCAQTERERAVLELLYGTGVRGSELCRLKLREVDSSGVLWVKQGKGRKDRLVPFGERVRQALREYLKGRVAGVGEEHVFLGAHGGPLRRWSLLKLVRGVGERAGIKAYPYRLRHSYATHLLRHGANVREVQALLGHRSLASTEVYTEVETQDLAEMLARCHPRERSR